MGIGAFMLDFFFGPCIDARASVDPRQNEPRPRHKKHPPQEEQERRRPRRRRSRDEPPPPEPRQRRSHDEQPPPEPRRRRSHDEPQQPEQYSSQPHDRRPGSQHRDQVGRTSGRSSSRRVVCPPAIPENQEQVRVVDVDRNGEPGRGDSLRSSGTGGHRPPHKTYSRHRMPDTSGSTAISSLSDTFNGKRRTRRDDAASISASLYESYTGLYAEDGDDFLDQQSAIRHSLKDTHRKKKDGRGSLQGKVIQVNGHSKQHRSDSSQATGTSELESWIERGNNRKSSESIDYENVTTISKASKNPYRVLGISQDSSLRNIAGVYRRKMKETERRGVSDMVFDDIENAYRRIRADIKRREAREERRRSGRGQQGRQQGRSESQGKKKKRRNRSRHPASDSDTDSDAKSRRDTIDARLKDHRELVESLFEKDNSKLKRRGSDGASVTSRGQVMTLQDAAQSQDQSLSEMNLVPVEAGATNVNEQNKTIQNSCFYLSLAASYLSGAGAFREDPTAPYYLHALKAGSGASVSTMEMEIATLGPAERRLTMDLALQLKRAIEAAVLLVHPDWAKSGMVGEEVQAFSDFLVYALDSDSVLGHWAIAVFDEASGFVDVYRGRHYGKAYPPKRARVRSRSRGGEGGRRDSSGYRLKYSDCDEAARRACTLTLRYVPGHYQPLLPELTKIRNEGSGSGGSGGRRVAGRERPALEELLTTLEKWKVLHVVTDGRA